MSDITYTSPTERVNTWLDGSTLFIEFNNPARHNALSVDMWEAVPVLLALACLLYTSPSPRDYAASRMPSSA